MSNVLRLGIVDPNDQTRDALKSMLLGMERVWLEAECSRYEFFADVVGQTNPEIGVVCLDNDPEKGLSLIEALAVNNPTCSILVVSSSSDSQLILRSMRSGAKEFLTQPISIEDLLAALDRIGNQSGSGGSGRARKSKMIAVAGATGGVGSTSIAVNLGCASARSEENSPALIDLDLALGDADVLLDTIPDYTIVDVAQNISRLDFTLLKRSLTKHACGLYLLPRPVQLQDTALVTAENLHRVFGLLKATFSHLIVDLSKSYNSVDMAALQACDEVLLITQLDLTCLRNVVRLLSSFEETEGLKEKVKIIVNRAGMGNSQISTKKAQETVGCPITHQLPNDYRVMVEVRNNGVPLIEQAPKAQLTESICALADSLCHRGAPAEQDAAPAKKTGGLFGRRKAKTT